jgi:predicted NBD/HSP70 family sugar kinase
MTPRIGVDLGGTKIEVLALDAAGRERHRRRVPTPQGDYDATLDAIAALVQEADDALGVRARVGVGTPGSISRATGLLRGGTAGPSARISRAASGATCASPTTPTASRSPRRSTAPERTRTSCSA